VIQNQKAFDTLFSSEYLTFNNKVSAVDTKVDFNKTTMIAIFLGHQGTNNKNIIIKDILEYEDYIEVLIVLNSGKSGCGTSPILTSPFHLVTISKTDKPFVFKETMVEKHCVQ